MTERRAHPRGGAARPIVRALLVLAAVAMGAAGCVLPGAEDSTDSTIEVDREQRRSGDREGAVGDTHEIHGVEATVLEVGRVAEYSEIDTSGYVWARVRIENTSSRTLDFHRRHLRLEKPDGAVSNTTNIASEAQIEGGTTSRSDQLAPGAVREGLVIYTADDLAGQFALLYVPPSPSGDDLDPQRGVWVFESGPEQAE